MLHENVPGFFVFVLKDRLGSKRATSASLIQVSNLGVPVDRLGRWAWLQHKKSGDAVVPMARLH